MGEYFGEGEWIKRREKPATSLFFSSRFGLNKEVFMVKNQLYLLIFLMFSYKKKEEELMPESGILLDILWEENFWEEGRDFLDPLYFEGNA